MAALTTFGPCDLPADISEEDRGRTEGSKYEYLDHTADIQ
jgi:hypothetical protein